MTSQRSEVRVARRLSSVSPRRCARLYVQMRTVASRSSSTGGTAEQYCNRPACSSLSLGNAFAPDVLVRISAAVLAVCAAIGSACGGHDSPTSPTGASRPAVTLKVMTFNIQHGIDGTNRYNLQSAINAIARAQPDIVGLQEVTRNHPFYGCDDQPARIASGVAAATGQAWDVRYQQEWFTPDVSCQQTGRGDGPETEGLAFLTRRGLLSSATTPLPDSRIGLQVGVRDAYGLPIVVTHLSSGGSAAGTRRQQIDRLLAWAQGFGQPLLIVGDFNVGAEAPEMQPVLASFHDAWADAQRAGRATGNPNSHGASREHDRARRRRGVGSRAGGRVVHGAVTKKNAKQAKGRGVAKPFRVSASFAYSAFFSGRDQRDAEMIPHGRAGRRLLVGCARLDLERQRLRLHARIPPLAVQLDEGSCCRRRRRRLEHDVVNAGVGTIVAADAKNLMERGIVRRARERRLLIVDLLFRRDALRAGGAGLVNAIEVRAVARRCEHRVGLITDDAL
ncbi:MAG: hypothetical protein DMF93_16100 [Acidobacteria bacterium]|nr:MAG: hypothetical protein DMF93_16100 [Acidobacteriota bacterium]